MQFGSFLGSPLAAIAEEVQSFKVLKTSAALLKERTEEEKEMLVPSIIGVALRSRCRRSPPRPVAPQQPQSLYLIVALLSSWRRRGAREVHLYGWKDKLGTMLVS